MTQTYTITSPLHGSEYQTIKVHPKDHNEKLSTKYHFETPYRAVLVWESVYMHANYRGRHEVWRTILKNDDLYFSGPILDVGSGSGVSLMKLCKKKREVQKGSNYHIEGITAVDNYDKKKGQLKKIINNIKAKEYTDLVTLTSADLTNLPYSSDTFSLVTSPWALRSYDRDTQREILREMARVCKPGGHIIITDLRPSGSGPYDKWIKEMGWHDVRKISAGPNGWFGCWRTDIFEFQKPATDTYRHSSESLTEEESVVIELHKVNLS